MFRVIQSEKKSLCSWLYAMHGFGIEERMTHTGKLQLALLLVSLREIPSREQPRHPPAGRLAELMIRLAI